MARSLPMQVAALFGAAWVLAWLTYGSVSGDALLGFDGYPLIAASAMHSVGDLLGAFGDELMGGRYPDGRFYRPLVHLSFGLDHALGGMDPAQYSRTDLSLAALTATLLGLLAGSLAGAWSGARSRTRVLAALCTAGVYLLHHAQLEVVPYAPRRADALALLFVAAAALAARRGARPAWTGALALCALLSKESGVIALPVILAASYARPGADLRAAARATISPILGLGLGLLARTAVLGGLGGHAESGTPGRESLSAMAGSMAHAMSAAIPGGGILLGVLVLGGLVTLLRQADHQGRSTALLLLAWAMAGLVITTVSGRFHDWYALTLVAPLALLAGGLLGRGPLGAALAAALTLLVVTGQLVSPQRDTLPVAQEISRDQAERFEALIQATPAGEVVVFEPWVFAVATAPGTPPIFVHAPYSLSALAELTLSTDAVQVFTGRERPAPDPNRLQVQLVPGPPPPAAVTPR